MTRLSSSFSLSALALALAFAGHAPLFAQTNHPDLPPAETVEAALDSHPSVEAAAARLDAARAQAGMLTKGPHEITVTGSYVRRDVDTERVYNEYDTVISRAFRLPGKASLDRQAGILGVDAARNRMEDVRHQTSLILATLWYDWLTAGETARNDARTVANLERAFTAVKRRVSLRDAAPLDEDQAASALALARGQWADSTAREAEARALLTANFPDIPLADESPTLSEPQVPAQGIEALGELVITRSHEIGAAQADADKQSVVARRVKADRIADPSFGVHLFSERSGMEKGAGLVATIPIGGGYRAKAADEAVAMASSARLELATVRRSVEAMARADMSNAHSRFTAWQHLRDAANRARTVAERTAKGHELGAIDLSDLLYAERQANDARRTEIAARSEALRAILKLLIDSHTIWAPGHDED